MAKIKLGARPKNFKRVVSFPLLDGTTGAIECVFTYRTRTEFGRFLDEKIAAAQAVADAAQSEAQQLATQAAAEAAEQPAPDGANVKAKAYDFQEKLQSGTTQTTADYLADILEGWNLDEPLNPANLGQLCDELPAAADAIMSAYRAAVTEGRLGN